MIFRRNRVIAVVVVGPGNRLADFDGDRRGLELHVFDRDRRLAFCSDRQRHDRHQNRQQKKPARITHHQLHRIRHFPRRQGCARSVGL